MLSLQICKFRNRLRTKSAEVRTTCTGGVIASRAHIYVVTLPRPCQIFNFALRVLYSYKRLVDLASQQDQCNAINNTLSIYKYWSSQM